MTLKLSDFENRVNYLLARVDALGKRQIYVVYRCGEKLAISEKIGSANRQGDEPNYTITEINAMNFEFVDPDKFDEETFPKFEKDQELIWEKNGDKQHRFKVIRGGDSPVFAKTDSDGIPLRDTHSYYLLDMELFNYRFVKVVPAKRYRVIQRNSGERVVMDTKTNFHAAIFDGRDAQKYAEEHCERLNKEVSK